MVGRITSGLANDLGNLAQRVLSMIAKNCAGRVPGPGDLTAADAALLGAVSTLLERLRGAYRGQAFHKALEAS